MSLICLRCAASAGYEAGLEATENDEGFYRGDDGKQQEQGEKEMVPFQGIDF
jgi:hypothetical protein